jgi:hypothetical protein
VISLLFVDRYYKADCELTIPSLRKLVSDLLSLMTVACPRSGYKVTIRQKAFVDPDIMVCIDGRIVIAYVKVRSTSNRCFEVKAPMLCRSTLDQTF